MQAALPGKLYASKLGTSVASKYSSRCFVFSVCQGLHQWGLNTLAVLEQTVFVNTAVTDNAELEFFLIYILVNAF